MGGFRAAPVPAKAGKKETSRSSQYWRSFVPCPALNVIASGGNRPVPEENWLPINRKDEDMDIVLRVYVADLDEMKTWTAPKAEKLEAGGK